MTKFIHPSELYTLHTSVPDDVVSLGVYMLQVVTKALHRHSHVAALWIEAAAW